MDELRERARGLDYPAVVKTRLGNAGKGVVFAAGPDDLAAKFRDTVDRFAIPREKWPMVQEFLGSDVSGVCMIYDRGRLVAASAESYLRCKEGNRFSTSVYRRSAVDPEAVASCKKVADALGWHGVLHFDLIRDPKTGVGKITEINPRFWGGLSVAVAAGMDFPYMLYELALTGQIAHPPKAYREDVYARWVLGELDDRDVETAVVAGHSLGGRVAGELALLAPRRVLALALVSPLGAASYGFTDTLKWKAMSRASLVGATPESTLKSALAFATRFHRAASRRSGAA